MSDAAHETRVRRVEHWSGVRTPVVLKGLHGLELANHGRLELVALGVALGVNVELGTDVPFNRVDCLRVHIIF